MVTVARTQDFAILQSKQETLRTYGAGEGRYLTIYLSLKVFFYLWNKIPMPLLQLLHLTKYILTLYLQQMHELSCSNIESCLHDNALFQRERMALDHIRWLLNNSKLYLL